MGKSFVCLMLITLLGCTDSNSQTEAYSSSEIDKHAINERDPETTSQLEDDPATTNDESNDQPVGEYGTLTLCVGNPSNGSTYTLDADVSGFEVTTIYFPKGGNIDFTGCELNEDYYGDCNDDQGKDWEFEGKC